jgi:hypothetical protein
MNIPRSVWPRQVGYSLRAIDPLKVLEAAIARISEIRLRAAGGFRILFIFAAYSVVFAGSAESGNDDTTQQVMNKATITSQTISVEHIRIQSERPFAEVRWKLEDLLPRLDQSISEALSRGDRERAKAYGANGPKLSIFLVRDHGALLHVAGLQFNALQYEIGNPLTASKMTRYQLGACLYAPLRVALFEDQQGRGVFEYDKPSSFFGQFGDDRVTDVGRYLDSALESVLIAAAS